MSLLARGLARPEPRSVVTTGADPARWLADQVAAADVAGVTPDRALQLAAVYACVRVHADAIASLPLHLYRREPGGGRVVVADHPLAHVLTVAPNPYHTPFALWATLTAHVHLRGNAYCRIERNAAGRVVALWPLHPDRVEVVAGDAGPAYRVDGLETPLIGDEVLHLRGLVLDGVMGLSTLAAARHAAGLAMAAEAFGAALFSNGARPSGILSHPGRLSDDAAARLKDRWRAAHGGGKQQGVAVLEEGLKFEPLSVTPDDAQFLETRRFQAREIAAVFRVPPHMVGDLERATWGNIEHQAIEFVVHSLRPWLVSFEQEIRRQLLTPAEAATHYVRFNVAGLLRGDLASRYQAYSVGRTGGWLSVNDIRELEDLNPVPDGDGYLQPLNMAPLGASLATPAPRALPDPLALVPAMEDALHRIARRASQTTGVQQQAQYAARTLEPVVRSLAALMGIPLPVALAYVQGAAPRWAVRTWPDDAAGLTALARDEVRAFLAAAAATTEEAA